MEIYLDNAATTKVHPKVARVVNEFMIENFGNASSLHSVGQKAREALEKAREEISEFIGAKPDEIYFTSGGTESNNLAIRGLAKSNPEKKHIVTTVIEHPCVLETCRALEKQGYEVEYLGVDSEGLIDLRVLESKIREDTLVVSVMHVNNEIGVIQPIEEIGAICKKRGVIFHTDAVQSFAKLDIDVKKMGIDLMTASGHKINAPKGVGFLYVNEEVKLSPIITGGGQERGIRSGTESVSGIVGLAEATKLERKKEKILENRNKLIDEILKIPGSRLNGSRDNRVYNNLNISFYGIEGESLMLMLDNDGIYVSTGSACASTKLSESYVLKAIGVDDLHIHGSIRISIDEMSDEEIEYVIESIKRNVKKLEEMSPFKLELKDEEK